MTAYYGFVPSEKVKNDIVDLIAKLKQQVKDPLYPHANQLSSALTDEIIDNLLLKLVEALKAGGGEGHGLLLFLGGFIKTTMHGLLKVMLGHANNAEINQRTDFLRAVFLNLPDDEARIGFVLPDDLYQRFQLYFAEVKAGNGKKHTAGMVKAFEEFTDLAIIHFYDGFISRLNLGFLLKKGASVTRGQMRSQSISTFGKMIPALNDNELKLLSDYLQQRMLSR